MRLQRKSRPRWRSLQGESLFPTSCFFVQQLSSDLYKKVSSDAKIWEVLWRTHHSARPGAASVNAKMSQPVLLIKDQEIAALIGESKVKAEARKWATFKYLYIFYRFVKIVDHAEMTDITKQFAQFKKLISGWGSVADIDHCMKFKLEGYTRLTKHISAWLSALLAEFLVWKPLNDRAFNRDMFIFDATEKPANYNALRTLAGLNPPTVDALFRKHLGTDRPPNMKLTPEDLAHQLGSRDPAQSWIALKIAMQHAFVPFENVEHVFEFKRPFFPRGNLNWSFLLVAKDEALVFNLCTTN